MRRMWRIDEANALAAKFDYFVVSHDTRSTVSEIIQRHYAAGLAMRGRSLWSHRQPLVHCPALVCFEMSESDPAQAIRFDNSIEGVEIERKHLAQPGMEHRRRAAPWCAPAPHRAGSVLDSD